jgi:hypothetical protein
VLNHTLQGNAARSIDDDTLAAVMATPFGGESYHTGLRDLLIQRLARRPTQLQDDDCWKSLGLFSLEGLAS